MRSTPSTEYIDFGSTYEIHEALMGLIWGPGINLAIFLVLYSYRKYYIYLHVLYGLFAATFSLATAIPILLTTGIVTSEEAGPKLHLHYLVGIASISVISLQAILGIATRVINICNFSTNLLIKVKYTHQVIGYMVSILCKSNMYIIYGPISQKFWIFLGQDIFFVIIIILRKLYFPKMKEVITPKDIRDNLNKQETYQSLSQLSESKDYCVFANVIYCLQPMKINHPGGYRIIDSVKNRDVDRFIYGMYGSEAMPQISPHSHSFRSLKLLGKPAGVLDIKSNYRGFDEEVGFVNVLVKKINQVSVKGKIYELHLQKQDKETARFSFKNYENILQLGRFYSLSYKKTTRLYTVVNFLRPKNKQFLQRFFGKQILRENVQYSSQPYYPPSEKKKNVSEQSDYVPLLMKVYPGGQLTEKLIENPNTTLRLSHQKGLGLQLQPLSFNNIVIVAGGTGLFPFYDLIDLFFKNEVIRANEGQRETFIQHEPILQKHSLNHFTVAIFLAVQSVEDIHPIIYRQFLYLLKESKAFSLTLRSKCQSTSQLAALGCRVTSQRFEQILDEGIVSRQRSKVYICGPPKMNHSLSKYFRDRSFDPSLYCFV